MSLYVYVFMHVCIELYYVYSKKLYTLWYMGI